MSRVLQFAQAKRLVSAVLAFSLLTSVSITTASAGGLSTIRGSVRDLNGAVVPDANVSLVNAEQAVLAITQTNAEGTFIFNEIPFGNYELVVAASGFDRTRTLVIVRTAEEMTLEVALRPRAINEKMSVTANLGSVESVEAISQQVNVIAESRIEERAKTVLAQVVNEEVGVHLQRTGPTIGGIVVRGVTGNKVNVFLDGVRYTTSAQRGGISTFLNLLEPSSIRSIEVLRGPNSAQYGSDAIGGSIQLISKAPPLSSAGPQLNGDLSVFFNSADLGFGSSLSATFATAKFGILTNLAGRRTNTVRPGRGIDSHNAVTRFFGISSREVIDSRLPDTGFTQYGGLIRMQWAPADQTRVIASYIRGQQDGGTRYDQLLGGDGTLIGDLRNLMSDLFYIRYDRTSVGWLDGLTATYSFNKQREERVNQGGSGNPRASINHEFERMNVHGGSVYANKLVGSRQNLLFGAEFYNERMHSPAFGVNPVSNVVSVRRPRVPDNALYRSGGLYIQDAWDAISGKLRLMANVRYSVASYRSRAADAPIIDGEPLWPDDSLRVSKVTYRAGAVLTPVEGLSFLANIGTGFRAPHMTDLGALGLVGTGFEVSAGNVAGLGAEVGSTADETAVSLGIPVQQLESETSRSYELGFRYYRGRFDTDLAVFLNRIRHNIVKQSLILPPGAVGQRLGSETITSQLPNGVVFVDVAATPVLVRANLGKNQVWGIEHTFRYSNQQ